MKPITHADLSQATFREIGKKAIEAWSTERFDVLRADFLRTAKTHATGKGLRREIPFLSKKGEKELTVQQVLSVMDFPQAQRFANEFFDAIVPHWVEQQKMVACAQEGNSGGYQSSVQGNFVTKMLFKLIAKTLSPDEYVDNVVLQQKATWKDDEEKTITTRVRLR